MEYKNRQLSILEKLLNLKYFQKRVNDDDMERVVNAPLAEPIRQYE